MTQKTQEIESLNKRISKYAHNHTVDEVAVEFEKEHVAIYYYESDGSHAYMTISERGAHQATTLAITGTESMALHVDKEYEVLELWAYHHGAKYIYDYIGESAPNQTTEVSFRTPTFNAKILREISDGRRRITELEESGSGDTIEEYVSILNTVEEMVKKLNLGRIESELKCAEEIIKTIDSIRDSMIPDDDQMTVPTVELETLSQNIHGIRCALEEVKAGEYKEPAATPVSLQEKMEEIVVQLGLIVDDIRENKIIYVQSKE